ncbi:unnamed protein product [Parajaminaea phylloscopi]
MAINQVSAETEAESNARRVPTLDHKQSPHRFNEQTFYLPKRVLVKTFLTLGLVDFISLLDQTSLAAALPIVGADLNAGGLTSFVSTAYLITSTAAQLLYGRLSDIVGRKPLLLLLLATFFVGSLGASVAPSVGTLIAFRAIAGIGGGGLMTICQIIVSDVVPLRERGRWQGILGAMVAIANGIGPVIGGALASHASWRWIFRINLPVTVLGAAAVCFSLPLKPVEGNWKVKVRAIDWSGAALSLSSATLIVLGLTFAGDDHSWSSAIVLGPFLVGLLALLFFGMWQKWGAKASRPPLISLEIFHEAIVWGAVYTHFVNGWLFVTQVYLVPQFYQLAYGYSATISGALLLPLTVVQTLTSTVSGLVITWTGRYREMLLLGWALWAVGMGLMSTLTERSSLARQIGYVLLIGFGVGQTFQTSLVALQGAVSRKQMASVTAARMYVRNLGGAIGLALSSTLVNGALRRNLKRSGFSQDVVNAVVADPLARSGDQKLQRATVTGYREGFRIVFIVLAVLSASAFFAALFLMRHRSVDREDDAELKLQAKRELDEKQKGNPACGERQGDNAQPGPAPAQERQIKDVQPQP